MIMSYFGQTQCRCVSVPEGQLKNKAYISRVKTISTSHIIVESLCSFSSTLLFTEQNSPGLLIE